MFTVCISVCQICLCVCLWMGGVSDTRHDAIVTIPVCHETFRHSRTLRVFADGLSASAVVQVTVGDVNDNSPFFEPQVYALNVEATVGQGPLLIVQGADLDSGDYGTVSYSFVNDNGNDYFQIDAGSGELAGV